MFRPFVRPHEGMENRGRLDDGQAPPAQREGMLGSTEQEGGDTTKDIRTDDLNNELGSGNRRRATGGATPGTARAEEGLSEETANLGSEILRSDE